MQNNLPIKYAFFGTPEFATYVLLELLNAKFMPSLIITTPDKPAGRGLEISQSPVKVFALEHNIPVLQPAKLDNEFCESLKSYELDLIIVAAYGKIIPESILSVSKFPPLNVHPSLLPKYRGTSPVESQILSDEKNVGVTIIKMDKEMDHGPIVVQQRIEIQNWPISRNELNNILWKEGGKLLKEIIPRWITNDTKEIIQKHEDATFTKKISKEDGLLDLSDLDYKNYLKYLAYEGWPGVFYFKDNKRIKITKAKYENNSFIIERVIPDGKKEIDFGLLN